jgi:hypothetical protein
VGRIKCVDRINNVDYRHDRPPNGRAALVRSETSRRSFSAKAAKMWKTDLHRASNRKPLSGFAGHALQPFTLELKTPHIAAGTLRVMGATRSALFPDFPTFAETGLPDYQSLGWFGLFAPAGTPREVVAKVSADVGRVLALPDAKQRLAEQGAEAAPNTREAFTAFVNADITKWLELAGKAGIRLSP